MDKHHSSLSCSRWLCWDLGLEFAKDDWNAVLLHPNKLDGMHAITIEYASAVYAIATSHIARKLMPDCGNEYPAEHLWSRIGRLQKFRHVTRLWIDCLTHQYDAIPPDWLVHVAPCVQHVHYTWIPQLNHMDTQLTAWRPTLLRLELDYLPLCDMVHLLRALRHSVVHTLSIDSWLTPLQSDEEVLNVNLECGYFADTCSIVSLRLPALRSTPVADTYAIGNMLICTDTFRTWPTLRHLHWSRCGKRDDCYMKLLQMMQISVRSWKSPLFQATPLWITMGPDNRHVTAEFRDTDGKSHTDWLETPCLQLLTLVVPTMLHATWRHPLHTALVQTDLLVQLCNMLGTTVDADAELACLCTLRSHEHGAATCWKQWTLDAFPSLYRRRQQALQTITRLARLGSRWLTSHWLQRQIHGTAQ